MYFHCIKFKLHLRSYMKHTKFESNDNHLTTEEV